MSVRHIVHERLIPGQTGDGISPPEAAIIRNQIDTMPTVIAGNYTKRLGNYESLAAAIADLPDGGANGGEIQVDGEVPWTGNVQLPSGLHLTGRGAASTALVMDQGASVPALQLDSVRDVLLGGFSIIVPEGVTPTPGGGGASIIGACERITLHDLTFIRPGRGVNVQGAAGPTPGTVKALYLLNLRVEDSPVSTGIDLSDVEDWIVRDAWSSGNHGDGLKLRKKTLNGLVAGGFFRSNGQGGIGGGINAYAGGDSLIIQGVDVSFNASDGLSIKSGALNRDDPAGYGYIRRLQISGVRARGNGERGVDLNTTGDTADIPIMASVSLSDTMLIENGKAGMINNARNATISNVHAIRNQEDGFHTGSFAIDAQYTNCVAIANGQKAANTYDGFIFYGHGGSVTNCYANGADADDVGVPADYDSLTAYHRHGFAFGAAASGRWIVSGCASRKHATQTSSSGIRCYGTDGDIQIHQDGAGAPGSSAIYGGVGSTHFKTSGANIGLYIKTSGAPNDLTGWQRVTAT